MYYPIAPFVLFTATFVTTVLATPMNVHTRRSATTATFPDQIVDALNATNSAVQTLHDDIKNISSILNQESEVQTFLTNFSNVATEVESLAMFLQSSAPGTLSEDEPDSQRIMNFTIPVFDNLVGTVKGLTQQVGVVRAGLITSTSDDNLFYLRASLHNMQLGFNDFDKAIRNLIALDVIEQMDPVSNEVNNTLLAVIATI